MRTSLLTRGAVALAALAIGSVTLAGSPATADTPAGITRETVLGAADASRVFFGSESNPDAAKLVASVCGFSADDDYVGVETTSQPNGVDGVLIYASSGGSDESEATTQYCTFAAFAVTKALTSMSGTATITAPDEEEDFRSAALAASYPLSGEVYVTPRLDSIEYGPGSVATASGDVITKSATTGTSSRVVTPKTTAQKKAARKVYDRRVASAKKAYSKAKDKARSSTTKKSAAKKAYLAKKKSAKAAYRAATAGTLTIVVSENATTTKAPFTFTTGGRRL